MAQRDNRKRLGKKHRQPPPRPRKGRAPRVAPTTGAVDPRKRKALSAKKAALEKKKRTPARSPEKESRRTLAPKPRGTKPGAPSQTALPSEAGKKPARPADNIAGRHIPNSANIGRPHFDLAPDATSADLRQWDRAEQLANQIDLTSNLEPRTSNLPLIAICGRPNVGKSTLFNRLTGSRRSIVGDEPGITRDRIYGEYEWMGRHFRLVDTGGMVPDDAELIPTEIYAQAQVALEEADALVLVVDARTELASPDYDLVRMLIRGGKPLFLAVNKVEGEAMAMVAENFRQLGIRNTFPISSEHGLGIGDLLEAIAEAIPAPPEVALTEAEALAAEAADDAQAEEAEISEGGPAPAEEGGEGLRPLHRTHGEFEQHETSVAIIGRPNVGKSTLLNALTGTSRAIVSPVP